MDCQASALPIERGSSSEAGAGDVGYVGCWPQAFAVMTGGSGWGIIRSPFGKPAISRLERCSTSAGCYGRVHEALEEVVQWSPTDWPDLVAMLIPTSMALDSSSGQDGIQLYSGVTG